MGVCAGRDRQSILSILLLFFFYLLPSYWLDLTIQKSAPRAAPAECAESVVQCVLLNGYHSHTKHKGKACSLSN